MRSHTEFQKLASLIIEILCKLESSTSLWCSSAWSLNTRCFHLLAHELHIIATFSSICFWHLLEGCWWHIHEFLNLLLFVLGRAQLSGVPYATGSLAYGISYDCQASASQRSKFAGPHLEGIPQVRQSFPTKLLQETNEISQLCVL